MSFSLFGHSYFFASAVKTSVCIIDKELLSNKNQVFPLKELIFLRAPTQEELYIFPEKGICVLLINKARKRKENFIAT